MQKDFKAFFIGSLGYNLGGNNMRKKWESLYQTLDVLVPNQHYGVCCLTQGICEKLSEVHQVLIEGLEVKTSFEPLPE